MRRVDLAGAVACFALIGCMSRPAKVESLFDHGLPGQACDASKAKFDDLVEDRIWRDLDLRVAMVPLPEEAFGVPVRGYGEEWMLMEVALNRRPGVVDEVAVSTTLGGWEPCSTCTQEWMLYQLGEDGPTRELPKATPRRRKRRGPLRGLATLGKIIAAPVILLTTGSLDVITFSGDRARGKKGFGLTGKAMRWLFEDESSSSSVRVAPMEVRGTTLRCSSDQACIGRMPYRRSSARNESRMEVAVLAKGSVRECDFNGSQELDLPAQADPTRLDSLVPEGGFRFEAQRQVMP